MQRPPSVIAALDGWSVKVNKIDRRELKRVTKRVQPTTVPRPKDILDSFGVVVHAIAKGAVVLEVDILVSSLRIGSDS